jgi:hypothetical protein
MPDEKALAIFADIHIILGRLEKLLLKGANDRATAGSARDA